MNEVGWAFDVRRIDLPDLTIDAGQRLGMVLAQPLFDLTPDADDAPCRIRDADRESQMLAIRKAFEVRAADARTRGVPIQFVVFPELSIPLGDPDGLSCVSQQMESVDGDVVFIGGIEGIRPDRLNEVIDRFPPASQDAQPVFAGGTYANLCVIAVKCRNLPVRWYYQAKLAASQWEQPRNMARGTRVLRFVAPGVVFLCQICFDHIARDGEKDLNATLCEQLAEMVKPETATLDFVFVPQYNPSPRNDVFSNCTSRFLAFPDRLVKHGDTAVLFVNRAADRQEPSAFGCTSIQYRPGRWKVADHDLGPKGYELTVGAGSDQGTGEKSPILDYMLWLASS
ncbi:MAG: hypothetical protein JXR37_08695 [Kiritimatiellae bacterium]|nr:hypothetical protein [Kiritimatiellia bacterium]